MYQRTVASEPETLVQFFDELELSVCRIGLEAGRLSQWLHAGLGAAGRDVVLLETRHVKAALSAMTVKTDRKDAHGIAQLLRMGRYRPVHAKSVASQDTRALLVGRKLLQGKLLDVELSIRGISQLRAEGRQGQPWQVRDTYRGTNRGACHLGDGDRCDAGGTSSVVARAALWREFTKLHREMLKIARADKVCHRLMSTPGVGALVALTYRSALDDPSRFGKSSTVGAYFGLTPRKYQSGETDRDGGVSKVGDAMVRTALFEAAHVVLTRATRFSSLKRWALEVAKRRGMKRAKIALARKLGVVLHRMWMDADDFRWGQLQWLEGRNADRGASGMARF